MFFWVMKLGFRRTVPSALACAALVAASMSGAQDMRQRMNNRSAIIAGVPQGATSALPTQSGFNQPLVVARYAPFNGKWSASIVVLRPSGAGLTAVTQTIFRPGDGLAWSSGAGSLRYFGGLNPFAPFLDASADGALFGSTDSRGIAFHAIHLPELFAVVGQAMRSVNTSAGLIAVQSVAGVDSLSSRRGKRRGGESLTGASETLQQTFAVASVGEAALTWYVAVPETISLAESFTAQYAVTGCSPSLDIESSCVNRAGVAFVPFSGTLPAAVTGLVGGQRFTTAPVDGTGSEFSGMLVRLGYRAAAAVLGTVQAGGVSGALVSSGAPSGLFSEVATGSTEGRIYADLVASVRQPATSSYSSSASFLSSPIDSVTQINQVAVAYLAALRTTCDGCVATGSLSAGTTSASGRVRDDAAIAGQGTSGVNQIDGISPVRKIVR